MISPVGERVFKVMFTLPWPLMTLALQRFPEIRPWSDHQRDMTEKSRGERRKAFFVILHASSIFYSICEQTVSVSCYWIPFKKKKNAGSFLLDSFLPCHILPLFFSLWRVAARFLKTWGSPEAIKTHRGLVLWQRIIMSVYSPNAIFVFVEAREGAALVCQLSRFAINR